MESPEPAKETVLITGGVGYFGSRLGLALQEKGVHVILFDISNPKQPLPDGIKFVYGDIRSLEDLDRAFQGKDITCVFHVASFGMSGREQLDSHLIEDINVRGTENVLQACQRLGVPRIVYTSTFNVVFGGQVICNGDESLPYLPLHLHPDHYSRTKSVAERTVLEANGKALARGGGILRTCALRSAGIYGPGEQRHLPRIVNYIEKRLFWFVYGDTDSLVEFVHVDNLVQAHILAAESLKADRGHVAAGQPYFISDGRPVNNFEFFRPLVEGLGYPFPSMRLPLTLIYGLAFLTEMVHAVVGPLYNFQPFLTRAEVYKTGVTHYFSLEKARRELGYKPQPFDLQETVQWFKDRGHGFDPKIPDPRNLVWDGMVIFIVVTGLLTCLPWSLILSM
ncbi:short-chain dehydrogenase/reductase family 42E member 1 [Echinops telfairi]|uniref:Short-chain dehydrogenase/reductase family 42E member 1 n=1 Tax=Echinops telfairi TaxID=9371 RepID=A0ABM0IP49_ECHTE|nr:short-chain dehydrogenase/reductase family 42E member 1 [Echinops telfairi]